MVAVREKGKRGSPLARLALVNTLVKEDAFRRGDRVIAHVLDTNPEPRDLIEKALRFTYQERSTIPGDKLPGLRTNADGNVEGDVFALTDAREITALADWCDRAAAQLPHGRPLNILCKGGFTLQVYSQVLRNMASDFASP